MQAATPPLHFERGSANTRRETMGFFDKLKASVGIGGAKIEIHPDETLGFSGESIGVKVVVLGGKIEQKLNCVNLSLLDERPLTDDERAKEKAKQEGSS